jgi:hypothetical protein
MTGQLPISRDRENRIAGLFSCFWHYRLIPYGKGNEDSGPKEIPDLAECSGDDIGEWLRGEDP